LKSPCTEVTTTVEILLSGVKWVYLHWVWWHVLYVVHHKVPL
jgi:hypothetical protein